MGLFCLCILNLSPLRFVFSIIRSVVGLNTIMRSSARSFQPHHTKIWAVDVFYYCRLQRLNAKVASQTKQQCDSICFSALYIRSLRNVMFTSDKDMKNLTECCLTHCILHHHYVVNKSALLGFRTARKCKVSFYLEMN